MGKPLVSRVNLEICLTNKMSRNSTVSPEGLQSGDRSVLARAITQAESTRPEDILQTRELLSELLSQTGHSVRLAVTGPPGAGKSTFIESIGRLLISKGKRVAVLSVDPSSTRTYGSILGDKTRMTELSRSEHAFIRPSPSSGFTGGVSPGTRESILLCEAAGYDFIIIETVGVGQSEVAVRDMTDCFLLLLIAGAGDELQGLKKGIMEMADLIVLNKDDGENKDNVRRAKAELSSALRLLDPHAGSVPKLMTCSALENKGMETIFESIESFIVQSKASGIFQSRRKEQQLKWLDELLHRHLIMMLQSDGSYPQKRKQAGDDLVAGTKNVYQALDFMLTTK